MKQIAYTLDDLLSLESQFKKTLINSLSGFKMPVLIGTCNKEGKPNLAIFNSLIHIGATPPLVGIIVRPDRVERHTLQNIVETHEFTINHVRKDFLKKAHQTSARYSKQENEFEKVGLTTEYKDGCVAPFVKESDVKVHLQLADKINIPLNDTLLIIGKIKNVYLPATCIMNDGFIDLEKAGSIVVAGLDAYYETSSIARLSYAKTDRELVEIEATILPDLN